MKKQSEIKPPAHFNTIFSNLYESFSDPCLKRCLVVASEKGASSWLTTLAIVEHGFALHKGAFIDAICLRYGLTLPHLPSHCICGSSFNIDHAMNCKCGGFLVVASEKGASSWLTTLAIVEHGFALHKGAFIVAICLRYGLTPPHLPSHCICGSSFNIDHAMNCKCGGFPSIRHNEQRNITAELLTEFRSNVLIQPPLQPLTGKQLSHQSSNTEDNA